MTPDAKDALRRCERLFALISIAMEMERTFAARAAALDLSTRNLVRPILEDAIVRLEPLLADPSAGSMQEWVRQLTDLELELDVALSHRGWRAIAPDPDASPPGRIDPS